MQRARYFWFVALAFALVFGAVAPVRAGGDHGHDPKPGDKKQSAKAEHDGHAKDKGGHGKDGGHGKGGHDEPAKLDIFAGAIDLAIWTIVVFVILFIVLRKFAWGPMLE